MNSLKGEKKWKKNKNALQHRINFIAGFLPTCENPRGFSWFVFYLLNSLLKTRNKAYTSTL
jgi:hypothetical protein